MALAAFAQDRQASAVFHPADSLALKDKEIAAKAEGNKPSFVMLSNAAASKSALIHRAETGEAELHEHMADFFVIRSGRATLVHGGQLRQPRQVGPGEFAAAGINGGERRQIGPGDVIYIPARLPHHVLVDRSEPVTYLIIKAKE